MFIGKDSEVSRYGYFRLNPVDFWIILAHIGGGMPHKRHRHLEPLLEKRVRALPVVIVNGARQVGKSFLVRELLKGRLKNLDYVTLDNAQTMDFARRNPSTFLLQSLKGCPFAIDEAQKAPALFDSIKEIVDQDRRPSQFILLGSTEFSHRTKIKESLTGRATYLRLFPFTLSETKNLTPRATLLSGRPRVSRADTMRYLERGGMPAIFAIRDESTRLELLHDLIETTTERDLLLIAGRSEIEPTIAKKILGLVATLPETSDSDIATAARLPTKTVQRYLRFLQLLYFVLEVPTCTGSTGRPQHFLSDVAIAHALGAPLKSRLRTWVLLELMSFIEHRGERYTTQIETYRGAKGGRLDFIVTQKEKKTAVLVLDEERVIQQHVEIARSLAERIPGLRPVALAPVGRALELNGVEILPLEFLA